MDTNNQWTSVSSDNMSVKSGNEQFYRSISHSYPRKSYGLLIDRCPFNNQTKQKHGILLFFVFQNQASQIRHSFKESFDHFLFLLLVKWTGPSWPTLFSLMDFCQWKVESMWEISEAFAFISWFSELRVFVMEGSPRKRSSFFPPNWLGKRLVLQKARNPSTLWHCGWMNIMNKSNDAICPRSWMVSEWAVDYVSDHFIHILNGASFYYFL